MPIAHPDIDDMSNTYLFIICTYDTKRRDGWHRGKKHFSKKMICKKCQRPYHVAIKCGNFSRAKPNDGRKSKTKKTSHLLRCDFAACLILF